MGCVLFPERVMANPNPQNKFQKGNKLGRKPGQPNLVTKDIKTLLREAAEEVGFVQRVPVLDAAGKPTGQTELRYGKDGETGYLRWLAANHPGYFSSLYGKLIPFDVNQKTETKTVVRYETVATLNSVAATIIDGETASRRRQERLAGSRSRRRAIPEACCWSTFILGPFLARARKRCGSRPGRRLGWKSREREVKLGIGRFDQALEIIERRGVERGDVGVGETADDQVDLAHAPPPGPEQDLASPLVQSLARPLGHRRAPTPKARTRPGEAYIEGEADDVSADVLNSLVIPGRGRSPRARNPYSLSVGVDSGLAASRRPGMTKR